MTTTVVVKARAWGATVKIGDETTTLGAHEDRSFNIEPGQTTTFEVSHGEEPVAEEESAGEEAAATVQDDPPAADPAPVASRGKRFGGSTSADSDADEANG